ncbi:MAG: protease SohB [Deltaproteobacteria bacterium]|nr:protease SohB [Deltaproteobacteria bacterium]
MSFLSQYGLFLAKAVTVALVIFVVVARLVAMGSRRRHGEPDHLEVRRLDRRLRHLARTIQQRTLPAKEFKALDKADAEADKAERKGVERKGVERKGVERTGGQPGPAVRRRRVFVLDFHGDLRASQVANLRQEITAVVAAADDGDQVLLRLESPGGAVHGYGLAAAQLQRLRQRGLQLTVAVDKVAASGGYMMAAVADHIVAAPFAVLGSIGVVMQMPNFNRLLKKHAVDFELLTAGKHKRSLTMFGENSEDGRQQVRQELEDIHILFKDWIAEFRPKLNLDEVADGRTWYGRRAQEMGLVDALQTSDDWLLEASRDAELLHVRWRPQAALGDRLQNWVAATLERTAVRVLDRAIEREQLPPG